MAQVEMKDAEQVGQQQLYSLLVYIIRGWRSTEEFMGEFGSVLNSTIRAVVHANCPCSEMEFLKFSHVHNMPADLENIISKGYCDHVMPEMEVLDMGFSPLHLAAGFGNTDAMRCMIEHGCDMYARTLMHKLQPFNTAIISQQYESARLLVDCGYRYSENQGCVGLLRCVRHGQVEGVKLVISAGVTLTNSLWVTAMRASLNNNQCAMVEWLLDTGVGGANDVLDTVSGPTALYFARSYEMADLLLKKGAEPMRCNKEYGTALHYLIINYSLPACEAILKAFPNIINSTQSSDKDTQLYSPLHLASWEGNVAAMDLLLSYGADPHMPTYDSNTALSLACHCDSYAAAERLIKLGCDPNVSDNDGDTALIYATYNGNSKLCQLLIEHGADPTQSNKKHVTPLWNAVYSRALDIVQLLLTLNVDPHVCSCGDLILQNGAGNIYDEPVSPLFVAVHTQQISMAKALVAAGCYINQTWHSDPSLNIYIRDWEPENRRWFDFISHTPPKLAWWCKKTIRTCLPVRPQSVVHDMNLPSYLKQYILEI